jgi:hypothetical protein
MVGDRNIELEVSGDLDEVGSPLVRELADLFKRHGFDAGFVFSAFALDGDRWRFDSGVVVDDSVPECERAEVVGEALRWAAQSATDVTGAEGDDDE